MTIYLWTNLYLSRKKEAGLGVVLGSKGYRVGRFIFNSVVSNSGICHANQFYIAPQTVISI